MGKFRKKITPTEEGLRNARAQAPARAESVVQREERHEKKIVAIVFFSAAFLLLALSIVFLGINIARMRDYVLHYERVEGKIVDVETEGFGSSARLVLVISYTYDGQEYTVRDSETFRGVFDQVFLTGTQLYVHAQHPERAVTVRSADSFSLVSAPLYALGAVTFLFIVRILSGANQFKRRVLCAYLPVIALGALFVLLCLLALPDGNFSELFTRVRGSLGYPVVSGLALLILIIDGVLSRRIKKFEK